MFILIGSIKWEVNVYQNVENIKSQIFKEMKIKI